ncbi:hypothetical protein Cme02nite_46630 [Catellatospora methionotrophica]|uniref:Uncharacterized protein n=1 Tax=Catellatospora methionotrophica TaxID=121620 RepID=A0A8J3PIF1_9ACTN|nr:hypothetical protein [Catellatospora methionotrophica]GIG16331.1 hypothetical protein Cme02nite_46630 [Catellatospora methionotrophica]
MRLGAIIIVGNREYYTYSALMGPGQTTSLSCKNPGQALWRNVIITG